MKDGGFQLLRLQRVDGEVGEAGAHQLAQVAAQRAEAAECPIERPQLLLPSFTLAEHQVPPVGVVVAEYPRQTLEGIEERLFLLPDAPYPPRQRIGEDRLHQRALPGIVRGGRVGEALPPISISVEAAEERCAQPGVIRQGGTSQVGAGELPQVAGGALEMVQRPGRRRSLLDILQPDPAPFFLLAHAVTARRAHATRQVTQQTTLVSQELTPPIAKLLRLLAALSRLFHHLEHR